MYDAFVAKASLFFVLGERTLSRQHEPGPVPESDALCRRRVEPDAAGTGHPFGRGANAPFATGAAVEPSAPPRHGAATAPKRSSLPLPGGP